MTVAVFIEMLPKIMQNSLETGNFFQVGLEMLQSIYNCYETPNSLS